MANGTVQCNGITMVGWHDMAQWHDGTMLRWWTKVVGEVVVVGSWLSGTLVA